MKLKRKEKKELHLNQLNPMMTDTLHGLVLIDKPSGISSHDVVVRLRKIFKTKSVGHSGTLDPLASGLMVCLLNEGTKLSQYVLEQNKSYLATFEFGYETDTLDVTGNLLRKYEYEFDELHYKTTIESFKGTFSWQVPLYSAIKVQGKKLYEYARNEDVPKEIPRKEMKFWDVRLNNLSHQNAQITIACSKGSYIRTWVSELGKVLGSGATLTQLRRTTNDPYSLQNALTLEEITQLVDKGEELNNAFISMAEALPFVKKVSISLSDEKLLLNGQISYNLRSLLIQKFDPQQDELIQVLSRDSGHLLALIGLDSVKGFQIKRVFNLNA